MILVTGFAGFIGMHLAQRPLCHGARLSAVGNVGRRAGSSGRRVNRGERCHA